MPPCYPERGAAVTCGTRPQPGVGQRALHEPAATAQSQPHASTPLPAGDPSGKVTCKPPVTTITSAEESPWRRRSSFEPHMPEPPLDLDDADLPVSEVWALERLDGCGHGGNHAGRAVGGSVPSVRHVGPLLNCTSVPTPYTPLPARFTLTVVYIY